MSLVVVTALCWVYLVDMAIDMSSMASMDMGMMQIPNWTAEYFWMMFIMWSVMMVGMMLPSVAPMVLIYASAARKVKAQGAPIASTGIFTLGYLIIWIAFSLLATIAQWGLDEAAPLSPMMVSKSPWMGAGLLIAAGIYQWLPHQGCLFEAMSVTFSIYFWSLADGDAWRTPNGAFAWNILSRMLLGDYAPPVCRGCHEYCLDCHDNPFCSTRKSPSSWGFRR